VTVLLVCDRGHSISTPDRSLVPKCPVGFCSAPVSELTAGRRTRRTGTTATNRAKGGLTPPGARDTVPVNQRNGGDK